MLLRNIVMNTIVLSNCGTKHKGCSYTEKGKCKEKDGHNGLHRCGKCGTSY